MKNVRQYAFLIRDVARLSGKRFEQFSRTRGLAQSDCRILFCVEQSEGATQSELAAMTGLEPMSLVHAINRLERRGWLERRIDETDRRVRRVALREEAKPRIQELWAIVNQNFTDTTRTFSDAELETLISLLSRIKDVLIDRLNSTTTEDDAPKSAVVGPSSGISKGPTRKRVSRRSVKAAAE